MQQAQCHLHSWPHRWPCCWAMTSPYLFWNQEFVTHRVVMQKSKKHSYLVMFILQAKFRTAIDMSDGCCIMQIYKSKYKFMQLNCAPALTIDCQPSFPADQWHDLDISRSKIRTFCHVFGPKNPNFWFSLFSSQTCGFFLPIFLGAFKVVQKR